MDQKNSEALLELIYDLRHSPASEKEFYQNELHKHLDVLLEGTSLTRREAYQFLSKHYYPDYFKRRKKKEQGT